MRAGASPTPPCLWRNKWPVRGPVVACGTHLSAFQQTNSLNRPSETDEHEDILNLFVQEVSPELCLKGCPPLGECDDGALLRTFVATH